MRIKKKNYQINLIIHIQYFLTTWSFVIFYFKFFQFTIKACYLVTWTPYAIVSMYRMLVDSNGVKPIYGTLPALFAKTSLIWTSLLYILLNKQIKRRLFIFKRRETISRFSTNNTNNNLISSNFFVFNCNAYFDTSICQ